MLKDKSKMISLVITLGMVFAGFAAVLPAISGQAPVTSEVAVEITEPLAIDIDAQLKFERTDGSLGYPSYALALEQPGAIYEVGEKAVFKVGTSGKWHYNGTVWSPSTSNPSDFMVFTKLGDTTNCEVWVADDLQFFPGDPRNLNPGKYVSINQTQAQYMADQFNMTILPQMDLYFGKAPARDGENSIFRADGEPYFGTNVSGKAMIMVYNYVDEWFFDPGYPGGYVAGAYSSVRSQDYDRNIIYIDNYDWKNRTGPSTPSLSNRYLYEGVMAHEWQHLLNDALNPDQETWLNEGCADYAIVLCGYPFSFSHALYFLATPDNALTLWGDQTGYNNLADYGAAGLFVTYIGDHFGPSVVTSLVNTSDIGVGAVNSAFANNGFADWNMDKVFNYWRLANLIKSDHPGMGWFNYVSVDLNFYAPYLEFYTGYDQGIRVLEYDTDDGAVDSRADYFGITYALNGVPVGNGKLGPYSTDYIQVNGDSWAQYLNPDDLKFSFGGDLKSLSGWRMVTLPDESMGWWSDDGDQIDWQLWGEADLEDAVDPALVVEMQWDIENGWDFAFVQVSTDGGESWTSLANAYTTDIADPDVMPSIAENLPGLTGSSGGFVTVSFDLSAFAGDQVMYRFRYMTDWASHEGGVYIKSVAINGQDVDLASLMNNSPEPVDTNFMVTIYCPGAYGSNGVYNLPLIMNLRLDQMTEEALRTITSLTVYPDIYIIVSPQNGPADYGFELFNAPLLVT
jgi:immune inhibitor A